jgi:type I restriction enzyme M protein
MYLPDSARYSTLLNLPEDEDIGKAINEAMRRASCPRPTII